MRYYSPDEVINELKFCRGCQAWKIPNEYHRDKRLKSGLASQCRKCKGANTKKWYRENTDKALEYANNWRQENVEEIEKYRRLNKASAIKRATELYRKRTYGITPEEFDKLVKQQEGLCAICKKPESARKLRSEEVRSLAIDHCHATGKVRQLLCSKCNTGIGNFLDDPELLKAAIAYLEKHK